MGPQIQMILVLKPSPIHSQITIQITFDETLHNFINKHIVDLENVQRNKKKEKDTDETQHNFINKHIVHLENVQRNKKKEKGTDETLHNFINKHIIDLENVQRNKKKEKGEFTGPQVSSN
jgi:hypothetical protein